MLKLFINYDLTILSRLTQVLSTALVVVLTGLVETPGVVVVTIEMVVVVVLVPSVVETVADEVVVVVVVGVVVLLSMVVVVVVVVEGVAVATQKVPPLSTMLL